MQNVIPFLFIYITVSSKSESNGYTCFHGASNTAYSNGFWKPAAWTYIRRCALVHCVLLEKEGIVGCVLNLRRILDPAGAQSQELLSQSTLLSLQTPCSLLNRVWISCSRSRGKGSGLGSTGAAAMEARAIPTLPPTSTSLWF